MTRSLGVGCPYGNRARRRGHAFLFFGRTRTTDGTDDTDKENLRVPPRFLPSPLYSGRGVGGEGVCWMRASPSPRPSPLSTGERESSGTWLKWLVPRCRAAYNSRAKG